MQPVELWWYFTLVYNKLNADGTLKLQNDITSCFVGNLCRFEKADAQEAWPKITKTYWRWIPRIHIRLLSRCKKAGNTYVILWIDTISIIHSIWFENHFIDFDYSTGMKNVLTVGVVFFTKFILYLGALSHSIRLKHICFSILQHISRNTLG